MDDQDVTGLPLEQVISKILGPAGTHVKLTVLDPKTGQKRDLDLVRAQLLAAKKSHEAMVEELYLATLSRRPSAAAPRTSGSRTAR